MADKGFSIKGLSKLAQSPDINYTTVYNNIKSKIQSQINSSIEGISSATPGRKIIVVADSYGDKTFSGDNATSGKTFIDYFKAIVPLNWTVYSAVQSGASFLGLNESGAVADNLKFLTVLQTKLSATVTPEEITDIVVVGCWNEVNNRTYHGKTNAQIRSAIKTFCDTALATYSNASIMLCPVGTSMFNTTQRTDYKYVLECWTTPAEANARFTAVQDADCILTSRNMFRSGQWIHPNDKGGQAIANALLSSLMGHGVSIHKQYLTTSCTISGSQISKVEHLSFFQYQDGRNCQVILGPGLAITTTGGKAWSGYPNDFQSICSVADPIFVGSNYNDFNAVVPLNVKDTSGKWHDLTGVVKLFGNEIHLAIQNIGSSGWTSIYTQWVGIGSCVYMFGDAGNRNL